MKKIIALFFVVFLASCGSKTEEARAHKVLVCDSIKETAYDSTGKETVKESLRCDSVFPETQK